MGRTLLDAIEERAAAGPIRVTVVSPQNDPRAGYVVYEDSRRSSAERRLRRTLDLLHEAGIAARGAIVDPDPLQALRDALHQYAPVDEVIISTHPGGGEVELAARRPDRPGAQGGEGDPRDPRRGRPVVVARADPRARDRQPDDPRRSAPRRDP